MEEVVVKIYDDNEGKEIHENVHNRVVGVKDGKIDYFYTLDNCKLTETDEEG